MPEPVVGRFSPAAYHIRITNVSELGGLGRDGLGTAASEKASNGKTKRDDSGLAGKARHEFDSRWAKISMHE